MLHVTPPQILARADKRHGSRVRVKAVSDRETASWSTIYIYIYMFFGDPPHLEVGRTDIDDEFIRTRAFLPKGRNSNKASCFLYY